MGDAGCFRNVEIVHFSPAMGLRNRKEVILQSAAMCLCGCQPNRDYLDERFEQFRRAA